MKDFLFLAKLYIFNRLLHRKTVKVLNSVVFFIMFATSELRHLLTDLENSFFYLKGFSHKEGPIGTSLFLYERSHRNFIRIGLVVSSLKLIFHVFKLELV